MTTATTKRREMCDVLFEDGGLVDQAVADVAMANGGDLSGLDRIAVEDLVWQWLDQQHPELSGWYCDIVRERAFATRMPDGVYSVNLRDGTIDRHA